MSKYAEKRKMRRIADRNLAASEPEDEFSVIPDRSLRKYFRARAGRIDTSGRSYRRLKVELSPKLFNVLHNRPSASFSLAITDQTAVALGELYRDVKRGNVNLHVFSEAFGGRMCVRIVTIEEPHFLDTGAPSVFIRCWGFRSQARTLSAAWLKSGSVIHGNAIVYSLNRNGRRGHGVADHRSRNYGNLVVEARNCQSGSRVRLSERTETSNGPVLIATCLHTSKKRKTQIGEGIHPVTTPLSAEPSRDAKSHCDSPTRTCASKTRQK